MLTKLKKKDISKPIKRLQDHSVTDYLNEESDLSRAIEKDDIS